VGRPPAQLSGESCILRAWLRHFWGLEALVVAAMLATAAAAYLREPLTSEVVTLAPSGAGELFDPFWYADEAAGGKSHASGDLRNPLQWTCQLNTSDQWPWCGYGFMFDRKHVDKGIDLRGFERIVLDLEYRGEPGVIQLIFKDFDPRFGAGDLGRKPIRKEIRLKPGRRAITAVASDFVVTDKWRQESAAPADLKEPSFGNVETLELVSGSDGKLGRQQFRLHRIQLFSHIVSAEVWYTGLALFWILLLGGILLHRRRHIALIERTGHAALSESERLHRSILEASTDCIVVLDPDGTITMMNTAGAEAMEVGGFSEIRGTHWSSLWRGESAPVMADALGRAADGETVRFRAYLPTINGAPKWWDVVVTPMIDEQGTLTGLLSISRDITSDREKSEKLKWASEHDALTHLPNRRAFQARLQAATLRAMEAEEQVGLLLIDIDHFKHVNDTLGHTAGDDLLKTIAERLKASVRAHDFVARIGGDEFAILLENVRREEDLVKLGEQVVARIQSPVRLEGRMFSAGASIGVAMFPAHADSANDLFKNADTALYALKTDGRGGARLFHDYMLEDAEHAALQLSRAREDISEESVVPVYQPKFDLHTQAVVGLEALLRWRLPHGDLQLPETVEEAFKDYELAAKIGELMQHKVARDIRNWLDRGVDFGRVSINAAPAEFLRDDYAERLIGVLAEHGAPAHCVEIEVTEHAFLGRGPEYVARALEGLKEAGVTISLDDFGTGYSSLSHLRDFPVDLVKIDMSFVQQMTNNEEIAAIVAAVVNLARSLNIEVIAEGVETPAQRDLLKAMGCNLAQGHLFSAAVEAEAIAELVPESRAAAA
jgi:diguanylate cyclase (GGDEF)-like protein/PAS domain S-box-containing protein